MVQRLKYVNGKVSNECEPSDRYSSILVYPMFTGSLCQLIAIVDERTKVAPVRGDVIAKTGFRTKKAELPSS
jgi:hypothetical protein